MSSYKISSKAEGFLSKGRFGLYIDNEWKDASSAETIDIVNPNTEERIAEISVASEQDVEAAITSSKKAFKSDDWKAISPYKRVQALNILLLFRN